MFLLCRSVLTINMPIESGESSLSQETRDFEDFVLKSTSSIDPLQLVPLLFLSFVSSFITYIIMIFLLTPASPTLPNCTFLFLRFSHHILSLLPITSITSESTIVNTSFRWMILRRCVRSASLQCASLLASDPLLLALNLSPLRLIFHHFFELILYLCTHLVSILFPFPFL